MLPILTDLYGLSWEIILSHSRVLFHIDYLPIPWRILPDGTPNARGPLEVLVGLFTDLSDFLGRLLVIVEFYSRDYLFTWLHVFVSDDVLWRNYFIKRVELCEPSSIHGTISRESTFHLYFVKVESGFSRND